MPNLELHADFDRDGRLSRSSAERSSRLSWPGAIVVPNMDRERLRLPTSVGNASLVSADYDLVSTITGDDELLPIEIRTAVAGALQPGETLHLRCSGVMHTRVKLSDDTGRIVPHRLQVPEIYELPLLPSNGVLKLTLQVRTIAGAAFGRVSRIDLNYQHDSRIENRFTLTLIRRDTSGVEHEEDVGRFTVAPFILTDRTASARRLYMVSAPSNVPSVTDVRQAARAAHVIFVPIDHNLTGGDTWIQDQYQHCMMQGPNGWRELILHLPRLRHENTDATVTDNLEDVVNTHFRSRNVGLFRDLWNRVVPIRTETGVARPSFRDLDSWVKRVRRIDFVNRLLNLYATDANPNWRIRMYNDWVATLLDLDAELARVCRTLDAARADASYQRGQQLEMEKTTVTNLVNQLKQEFSVSEGGSADPLIESDLGGGRIRIRVSIIRKLFNRANQMHASMNYGGNIESTPPVAGAPLGKILLGNKRDSSTGEEWMDPDLLRVFVKQQKQPIVEIDTTWLKVGHVDEMMAVVPSRRVSGGFAVLHASSQAAIALLRGAQRRYLAGLPMEHIDRVRRRQPPSGLLARLMTDGTSPVTRLFRGKAWIHKQSRARYGEVSTHIEPPEIYFRLCQAFGSSTASTGFNIHGIGYVPGEGADRRYPADISVTELLWAEADGSGDSCNAAYDTIVLEPSREILRNTLSGIPVLPIPVLFDRTFDIEAFRRNPWARPTTAFTPDIANMQVLNGHLLVPKPYGPRMLVDDAIAVVQEAMTLLNVPGNIKSRVGRRLISARRMTQATYWVERVDSAVLLSAIGSIHASYGGLRDKVDVIAAFRDSFPGANAAERERRVYRPNRSHFNASGYLKNDFSLFRINDGMVDIFELFVAAIAAGLDVHMHFVDSWSYHLYDGQIHCGTNVLRERPSSVTRMPNVWDAPDHPFRSQTVEFEEDIVTVGADSR